MTAGGVASVRASGIQRLWGLREGTAPCFLVVLAVLQSPGKLTFDTDLGLALNPVHLLRRASHLWGAEAGFGGVGDQTYGFLFPIGPFFALGHALGLPPWLVQRLWCAVVLVLAYDGMRRLVRRMLSPQPLVGVVAGLAWALSPRMLTVVGPFSSEALAVALAPWLLLPLVAHLHRDVRRTAWLSGLVVLGLGSVNAAATLAVLPLPVLFLLTRSTPWRDRARSLGWWSAGVLLGAGWWIGPLLLLGAYSPPFIDWVESARTTTDPVSALAALRGVTDWVGYVPEGAAGFWPAAWNLATSRDLALVTLAVAVLGLAGLASRRLPEQRFLLLSAALGFTLLTMGHQGSPGGPLAAQVRDLLDRQAVPFRNIYKFDPVLRLPIVLGLAHLLHQGLQVRLRLVRPVLAVVVAAGVLVGATPAFAGQLRPGPAFSAVPAWWSQAADYLAAGGVVGRTLVVPEATTGRYTWGRTIGEPLEALAHSPWAVRNQVPLTLAGNTRLVDAVESVLATGRGSAALADVLARSGVGQVLVRNDLSRVEADSLPPVRVRQALDRSPGLRLVKGFGPPQRFGEGTSTVDGGIDLAPPALQVWVVDRPVATVHTTPLDTAVAISGGPEDLLTLLESGVLRTDQATVLASDAPRTWSGPRVVSDGLQRRERSFGRVHDATGPLLTATEPYRQVRAAHDLLPAGVQGRLTTARYDGTVAVTASSSAAYPDSFGGIDVTRGPEAALDADPTTYWQSGALTRPEGQWLEVVRTEPSDVDQVTLTMVSQPLFGPQVRAVRVTTDAGSRVVPVATTESPQVVPLPAGRWTRLRITLTDVVGNPRFGVVGLRELALPGRTPTRSVVAASRLPAGSLAPAVVFRAVDPTQACVVVAAQTRCDAGSARPGEEAKALRREFALPQASGYVVTGTVLASAGVASLLQPFGNALVATASSTLDVGAPTAAMAAVDGDPRTSWVARPGEPLPALAIRWPQPQDVSELVLEHAEQPASSVPLRVHVHAATGDRDAVVGVGGRVSFAPLRTNEVVLTFPELRPQRSTSSRTLLTTTLPVGVAEVRLPQVPVPAVRFADTTVTGTACGFGPDLEVDGRSYDTQVLGTVGDLRAAEPLLLGLCGPGGGTVDLAAGPHRITATSTTQFRVRSLVLRPAALPVARVPARTVTVHRWDATHRSVTVASGAATLLVVPEAANPGWHATAGGRRLTALTVDGWQQGWLLPAGAALDVRLDFAPDRTYRLSLLLGALAVLLLLVLALRAVRHPDTGPLPEAAVRRLPWAVLGLGLCALAGGAVCAFGLLLGAALLLLRRDRIAVALCWLLPGAAGVVLAAQTSRVVLAVQSGEVAQTLSLLAVGLLTSLLLRPAHA